MSYQDFCENCRLFYRKKLYKKSTLDAFVRKGKLQEHERDQIINDQPFDWEPITG